MELWQSDATELAGLIRAGKVSSVEATTAHLQRLEAVNPSINAVVRVLADEALDQARAADEAQARGQPLGLLHGVPVTTKIVADQRGCPTDNGIVAQKDLIAAEDGAVVANLRRGGAIFIGRTAAPALSMRAMTSSVLHGLTLNPWNAQVTCGGSSGGAGAAVAAGIGAIAHGSDIGGSIRWPAYCNGVVGLRTSLGRVSSYNPSNRVARSLSSQLMAVSGPLARSVRDLRLALEVMAAGDPRDGVWTPAPLVGPPAPRRVALAPAPSDIPVHPAVAQAVRDAGRHLQAAGYQVEEVELPHLREVTELWTPIGLTPLALDLPALLARINDPALSNFLTSWVDEKGIADLPGYLAALARRDSLLTAWNSFFERYPIIVMPSCPDPSLPAELDTQGREGALRTLEGLRFQLACPVLGLPGLAVPVGQHAGQPLGVQIVAARFREDLCLAAAEVIEAHEGVRTPIDPQG
ncbi:MAG: amidase [Phenylobacterium sp.]